MFNIEYNYEAAYFTLVHIGNTALEVIWGTKGVGIDWSDLK